MNYQNMPDDEYDDEYGKQTALQFYSRLYQNEVTNHWTRNNYFLVVSSIMLVALTQVKTPLLQLGVGIAGVLINLDWALIQLRSARYLDYWSEMMIRFADEEGWPGVFSPKKVPYVKPDGLRVPTITTLARLLPYPFLFLWAAISITTAAGLP